MKDTYKIKYKCWNCLEEFDKEVLKGRYAKDFAGKCPHCDVGNSTKKSHEILFYMKIHKDN